MNNFKTSVIIPAYNCSATISKTINSLLKQRHMPDEIIIVDDGSTDDTAQIVKQYRQVHYVFQKNSGPAAARNNGAFLSHGDILFFTDSDCVPTQDWIMEGLKGFSHEEIGAVCGTYGNANPQYVLSRCIHDEIQFRHHHLVPDEPKVFGSYNVAIRRGLFVRLSGFNQKYSQASGEDNDLSYRLRKSGHKIIFNRKFKVDHFHTTSLMKYLLEQFRHGFWRAKMYRDHVNMVLGDDYTFWKDSVEIILAFIFIFSISVSLGVPLFNVFWPGALLLLISIELFFAFRMISRKKDVFFGFVVMLFRVFFRGAGFSSGILRFFLNQ
ncbi:MAG: glycosyltransferase family 2 protein [Candidatus Omnitrophica bacterium]|nr:glycosyltransferase family 2 protein [Candidatus Omnitrophota bacterium]